MEDDAPKSSERLAASLYRGFRNQNVPRLQRSLTYFVLYLLKLSPQVRVVCSEFLHAPEEGNNFSKESIPAFIRERTHIMAFSCFALIISRLAIES